MKIDIYIIDPDTALVFPADAWLSRERASIIKCSWLIIHADGFPPFQIHKNNLYDRCATADYIDCCRSASHSSSRLGTEIEWRIVHEAKIHNGLDRILSAIDGDVVGCKPTFTENGTVVRSYCTDGYMETFDRSKLIGRVEIFARAFKSVIK